MFVLPDLRGMAEASSDLHSHQEIKRLGEKYGWTDPITVAAIKAQQETFSARQEHKRALEIAAASSPRIEIHNHIQYSAYRKALRVVLIQ